PARAPARRHRRPVARLRRPAQLGGGAASRIADDGTTRGMTRRRGCPTMTPGHERQRQAPARWPATLQPRWGAPGDDTADRRGGGGKRGPWWAPRFEEHTDELSPHPLTPRRTRRRSGPGAGRPRGVVVAGAPAPA